MIEIICYAALASLSLINFFHALPIVVNTTAFSLLIIIAGSHRSVTEMISNFKAVFVDKKKQASEIETITKEDAMQFPLYAGGMLCFLYGLIKYFGKEVVNPLLLGYMGLGASTGIKGLLVNVEALSKMDQKKLVKLKVEKIGLDLEVSPLDIISLLIAYAAVAFYLLTKNWLFNNILAMLFCVHGIQYMFLGNFQTGFILLTLLFFYDIFFVFGTDVMLTVAKSIDAPIKLLFPKDWSTTPPEFSLLGLGDIVLPGVFIAMCLRYDILRSINVTHMTTLCDAGKAEEVLELMKKAVKTANRTYFYGALVGYVVAIITTVAVMIIFDHGQPALLYLVPGVLSSVLYNAYRLGELTSIWDFNEEKIMQVKKDDDAVVIEDESDGLLRESETSKTK